MDDKLKKNWIAKFYENNKFVASTTISNKTQKEAIHECYNLYWVSEDFTLNELNN